MRRARGGVPDGGVGDALTPRDPRCPLRIPGLSRSGLRADRDSGGALCDGVRAMGHHRGVHAVFVPGSGRSGAPAWPTQATAVDLRRWRCRFVDLTGLATPDEQRDAVTAALGTSGHLVAHAAGAVAALRVAELGPGTVRSLVLLEPAAFSAARGGPHVEAYVAAMAAVFAHAGDPRVRDGDVAVRYLSALGAPGAAIADPGDPSLRSLGRRVRRSTPPWQVPLDVGVVARVPTLVVTGGWSPLYEEVAAALVAAGASTRVLPGYGHRVQDHPGLNALLQEHWAAAEG